MRNRLVLIAALLLAAPAAALAGNGTSLASPGPAAKPSAAPEPAADGRDPLCASYGAGFIRLSGTSTCVKISGNVQVDGANQSFSGGMPSALEPALRSQ